MTTHYAAQVRNSSRPGTSILDCSGGRAVDVVFASDELAKVSCKRCLKKIAAVGMGAVSADAVAH